MRSAHRRDADIEAKIEAIVDDLEKAQAPDGYLNCWYLGREPDKRWTNLRDNHELYNRRPHARRRHRLFPDDRPPAAARHHGALCRPYPRQPSAPSPGQKRGYCGHQEIELALIKLYRLTGERKHLDLAAYFINERGRAAALFRRRGDARAARSRRTSGPGATNTTSRTSRCASRTKVVGHAVRAMYMYTAMADLAAELDDAGAEARLRGAVERRDGHEDVCHRRPRPSAPNEGFTDDYDLPNETAYAETCASVALIFWAQRMLHLDLDGRYADVLELALYNGALAGLRRDGEHYFYANPLESDGTPQPLGLAHLPVLHDERHPARRLGRRLFRLDRRRRHRLPPLWRHLDHGRAGRRQGRARARPATIRGRATSAIEIDPERRPTSTLSCASPAGREARPRRSTAQPVTSARDTNGYVDDHAQLAAGRHGRARPADAARAHLCQPGGAHGCRPRRAEARAAGLLRRGGRQSRRPGAARSSCRATPELEAAARAAISSTASSTLTADAARLEDGDWNGALYRTAAAPRRRRR